MSSSCMSRNTPSRGISPNGSGGEYGCGGDGRPLPAGRAVDHGVDGGSGPAADPSDPDGGSARPGAGRAGGCGRTVPRSELSTFAGVPLAGSTGAGARVAGGGGAGAAWTRNGGAGGGVNGGVEVTDPVERVGGRSRRGGVSGGSGDPASRTGGIGATCGGASGDPAGRGGAGGGPAGGGVAGRSVAESGIPGREATEGGVAGRDVTDGAPRGAAARGGGLAAAPAGGTGIEPIAGRETAGGASGGTSRAGIAGGGADGGDETTRGTRDCPATDASPGAAATVTVSLVAVSVGPGVRNSRDTASRRISRCSASMSEPRARVVSVRSRRSCPSTFSTRSLRSKATSPRSRATCSLSACSISRRKVRSNCAWYSRYSRRGSGAVRIPTSLYTGREASRPVETTCGSSSRRGGRKYATTAAQIPSSTPIRNCFWESPRTTRATAMAPSPSTNKMPNHRTKVRPRERGIWRAYRRKRISQGGWPERLRSESAYQSGAFPLAGRLVEGSIPARSNKQAGH